MIFKLETVIMIKNNSLFLVKKSASIFLLCICFFPRCGSNDSDDLNSIMLGAAVGSPYLAERSYSDTLKQYFNCVVPENHMKWEEIQPTEGSFAFTNSDVIVNFASDNKMAVRGHTLLWHMQTPAWVTAKTYLQLEAVLQNHINTVVSHYKGKVFAWDVVNEIIKSSSYGLRNSNGAQYTVSGDYSIWSQSETDDYLIKKAFEFAHTADPDALLFVNDNNNYGGGLPFANHVYWNQIQADLLYNYVAQWVSAGVPVHGMGMQLHLDESYPPVFTMIENDIIRYGALGLKVHFTEVDVRIAIPVTPEKLQHQAEMYNELAKLAAKYPNIVTAFVTWGVSDKYSWIPFFSSYTYDSALLFDENYIGKPAYRVIKETLGLKEFDYAASGR